MVGKGHNTTHALTDLVQHVYADADKGLISKLLFLDYTKASDHVDHTNLIQKIINHGISPQLSRWMASFLFRRKQRAKIVSIVSEWDDLIGCVPQGYCLGPLSYICHP